MRPRAIVLPILALMLIAGHGLVLYFVKSHITLSTGVIGGVVLLIVIKHLGLLAPLYAMLRRRFRRDRHGQTAP